MAVSPIQAATLAVSSLVLLVSFWNLYLSHYKENRSEVKILEDDPENTDEFAGGNHAANDDASWNGSFRLNVVNSGEKSATVSSFDHHLKALQNGGSKADVELEVRNLQPSWNGKELEPHSSQQYRRNVRISPSNDFEVLVENDYAVIEHVLHVSDNKGSYSVREETEMKLTGPDAALENWREKND